MRLKLSGIQDKLIERWANACAELHDYCSHCPEVADCQQLGDYLIGKSHLHVPAGVPSANQILRFKTTSKAGEQCHSEIIHATKARKYLGGES